MTLIHYFYAVLVNLLLFLIFWYVARRTTGFTRYTFVGACIAWGTFFYLSVKVVAGMVTGNDMMTFPCLLFLCAGYVGMFLGSFWRDWRWRKRNLDLVDTGDSLPNLEKELTQPKNK